MKNTLTLSLARVDRSCPSNLEAMETRLGSASTAVTSRPSPNDRKRVKWPYDEDTVLNGQKIEILQVNNHTFLHLV